MTDETKTEIRPFVANPPRPFGAAPLMAQGHRFGMRVAFDIGDEGQGGGYDLPDDVPMDPEEEDDDADPFADPNPEGDDDDGGDGGRDGQQGDPPETVEELKRRLAGAQRVINRERARRQTYEAQQRAAPTGGERQQQRPAEPEAFIDPEVDPIGSVRQLTGLVQQYQEREAAAARSTEEAQRQERGFQQIQQAMNEYEADFRVTRPDYGDAAVHFANQCAQELAAFGVPQNAIQGMIRQQFAQLVAVAIQSGNDPAATVYKMAQARGYKAKAAGGPRGPGKPAAGADGQQQARKTPNLDRVRAAQRQGSPLGRAGRGGGGAPDPGTLANIDIRTKRGGEEFDKGFDAIAAQQKALERGRR